MAHYNKGVVLGNLDRHVEALNAYTAAVGLDPNYTYAFYNRAVEYAHVGKKDEMLEDLARAIELDPSERDNARDEDAFDPYRDDPDFRRLVYPEEF